MDCKEDLTDDYGDSTSGIPNSNEASTNKQGCYFTWAEMTLQYLHPEISVSKWKQRRDHGWQEAQ